LSFSGQNLFDKSHLEFGASALLVGDRPIAVARSLVGKLTWRF
jgi:hypothetical protein